jgi:hypothetical protein
MITAEELVAQIERHRFDIVSEARLQFGLDVLLTNLAVGYEREVRLSPKDRIDFLTRAGIGIECKIQGGVTPLLRQLMRYAEHERVRELVLVTSRLRLAAVPETMNGKRIHVAVLLRSMI